MIATFRRYRREMFSFFFSLHKYILDRGAAKVEVLDHWKE